MNGANYRHVLGDPGLGKSQLLQAAATVSPRGIYVCGNATTNAGLTVAVVRDSMTGDYAFEAGGFLKFCHPVLCLQQTMVLLFYTLILPSYELSWL